MKRAALRFPAAPPSKTDPLGDLCLLVGWDLGPAGEPAPLRSVSRAAPSLQVPGRPGNLRSGEASRPLRLPVARSAAPQFLSARRGSPKAGRPATLSWRRPVNGPWRRRCTACGQPQNGVWKRRSFKRLQLSRGSRGRADLATFLLLRRGRGTMRSMVEGVCRERRAWSSPPSTTLRAVPLPLRRRRTIPASPRPPPWAPGALRRPARGRRPAPGPARRASASGRPRRRPRAASP